MLSFATGLRGQIFFNPVFYRFLIEYGSLRWQNPFDSGFYMLLSLYGAFHVAALSVARILSLIFSVRVRSILYLSVSIVGFLAMIYLLNPRDAPVQSLIPDVASLIRATAATMIL